MPKDGGPGAGESLGAESSRPAHANGGAQPGAASSDGDDFANRLMVEVQPAARLRCVRTVAGAAPCVRQGRPVLTATDLGMRCRPI